MTRAQTSCERRLDWVAERVRLPELVGSLDMLWLERHARPLATDSGSVQKEACEYALRHALRRDGVERTGGPRLEWQPTPYDAASLVGKSEAALAYSSGAEATPDGDE